jgi:hypothetical protein
MNRQITVLVVEGVEQGQLLTPMSDVRGIVDIENNPDRRSPVRFDKCSTRTSAMR